MKVLPPLSWLPNLITAFRLTLVPLFVVAARAGTERGWTAGWAEPAVWIVVVAGVSDVLDGFVARRWDLATRVGALLDAVADKSFQFTALTTITLVGPPLFSQLPLFLLVSVFLRDFLLLTGWGAMRRMDRPVDFEHTLHGRLATVLVFLLIVGACVGAPEDLLLPVSAVASLAALSSAGFYLWRGFRLAHTPPPAPSQD